MTKEGQPNLPEEDRGKNTKEPEPEKARDKYKKEYLPLRVASRKDPEKNQERLKTKSEIADKTNRGDPTLSAHFQRLKQRKEDRGEETGEQFASRISDGSWWAPKRGPSIMEAILTTEEQERLYEKITREIGSKAIEIMRVGASFWGRNFSVRSREGGDSSDIDLEIIFDEIPESLPFLKNNKDLEIFRQLFQNGLADFFVFKEPIDGVETSFHCIPLETFIKVCNLDYENVEFSETLKEFRATREIKPKRYKQKNFAGRSYFFTTHPQKVGGGQISEIPLVMIGEKVELVPGTILNKYLPVPELKKQNQLVQEGLQKMISSLRKRKNKDRILLPGEELSFEYFHYGSDRMPEWIKKELRALD